MGIVSLILMLVVGGGIFAGVSQVRSCGSAIAEADLLAKVAGENAERADGLAEAVEIARAAEAEARAQADATTQDADHRIVVISAAYEAQLAALEAEDGEAIECPLHCVLPSLE